MITRLPALLALVLAPVLVTAANPVQVPAEVPVPDPDPPQVRSLSDHIGRQPTTRGNLLLGQVQSKRVC